ncbi:hypothetical protein Bca52824_075544 [Brassica carinata]|uniref:Uncharacterized protein n=1 Tax=Brassica carinata TaxID=52824 RepID=A0A8X7PRG1_BRACI|nr:hypothetical protein Bca52824_075544 [Brassica carinata]
MMRDSIPELLALPELKHPIGSEPKPKEPLDGSHASPLSQQVETQMEKEPSNQTHAAQSQIFSTNVTQQVKSSEKLVYTLNFQPLNESPASPLSQQIETHVYSPDSAQHKQCLEALVHIHDGLPDFLQIEKEQLNEAPDAHTEKEIEPSLDEMPSNPNRGEENLDDESNYWYLYHCEHVIQTLTHNRHVPSNTLILPMKLLSWRVFPMEIGGKPSTILFKSNEIP